MSDRLPVCNLLFLLFSEKNMHTYHGISHFINCIVSFQGARCSSVVRAFAHGVMGRQIDPSWGGPIELFLVPASAPRLV